MTDWDCADCGVNTLNEYYMVHNEIWEQFGCEPLLCVGCLEDRLGRQLWTGDFTHVAVNNINMFEKSDRLFDRLTNTTPPLR